MYPSGSQPSGGIFIHMAPMTTSTAKATPYAMNVPLRPMLSIRLPHDPAILTQPMAPKPKPATATPEIMPLRSGNHRMPTAIGTTYPRPMPAPPMKPTPSHTPQKLVPPVSPARK